MTFSAFKEFMTAILVFTLMGIFWGWWPIIGFVQGAVAAVWLIAFVLELFFRER